MGGQSLLSEGGRFCLLTRVWYQPESRGASLSFALNVDFLFYPNTWCVCTVYLHTVSFKLSETGRGCIRCHARGWGQSCPSQALGGVIRLRHVLCHMKSTQLTGGAQRTSKKMAKAHILLQRSSCMIKAGLLSYQSWQLRQQKTVLMVNSFSPCLRPVRRKMVGLQSSCTQALCTGPYLHLQTGARQKHNTTHAPFTPLNCSYSGPEHLIKHSPG